MSMFAQILLYKSIPMEAKGLLCENGASLLSLRVFQIGPSVAGDCPYE